MPIQEYFIQRAFPGADRLRAVLAAVEHADSTSRGELLGQLNLTVSQLEQCLKLLEIDGAMAKTGSQYWRTANPWKPDEERSRRVTALRYQELAQMKAYVESSSCLMEFLSRALDDPGAHPCGKCAACSGPLFPTALDPDLVARARLFLRSDFQLIKPRRRWPVLANRPRSTPIPEQLRNAEGRALCVYRDAGWGELVAHGKYAEGRFHDDLVRAAAELILRYWNPQPAPTWVAAVPSQRHPLLVQDYARRLARALGLPFHPALERVRDAPEQKTMQNSAQQVDNIADAFRVVPGLVPRSPVLLVDDLVDSGWTLTICGTLLREAGSGPVHPFALASSAGRGGGT